MSNKKKVCFACVTKWNIFLSYILSKTVYKNDYKILILSDHTSRDVYLNIIKECNIWNEVILIKEADNHPKKRFKDIRDQLEKIDFDRIDVLHYFMFAQNSYNFILLDYISDKTKIIQTVYTAASYYIKEHYLNVKKIYTDLNVDLDKISEIWVYDERLHVGELLKKPLKNIEIIEYLKNKKLLREFCNELNKIFNYRYKPMDYDVIFFDQPIAPKYIEQNKEKQLFSTVLNEFKNYKIFAKCHHRSSIKKYAGFKINIIKENNVPWEVILLNELSNSELNLKNKIFVTYFSETLLTTHIFLNNLNIPHKTVWLKDILQSYTRAFVGVEGDNMNEKFMQNFKKIYRNNFYDIKSIDELENTLKSFN